DLTWLRKVFESDVQLPRQLASPLAAYAWARFGPVTPRMTAKAVRAVTATAVWARNWRQVSQIIGFPPVRSGGRRAGSGRPARGLPGRPVSPSAGGTRRADR